MTWSEVRIRTAARIQGGGTPTPDPANWEGDIPFVTPPDLRPVHGRICATTGRTLTGLGVETGSILVPANSIIVSKRAPIGYVARVADAVAFNQGCLAVIPNSAKVESGFLTWALSTRAEELNALGRGTTFSEISAGDLGNLRVPLPPLAEQRAIADYLDRETARVDTLIEEQQRLMEMLRERRRAVSEHAVLAASTTSQGQRLKHLVLEVNQGWSPQCYPWSADGVETWAVLKAGAANGGTFRWFENKELPGEEKPRPAAVVKSGQLVVSRANTRELVGSAAVVVGEFPRLMLCDKLYAFNLDSERAAATYVATVLGTKAWRGMIEIEASGSSPSMQNISQADILNLPMDLPSLNEQRRIADYLDDQTSKIDTLIAETERFIELSQERRSALITAAVTGQIDVREEVA